jgi:lysine-specific demethylase 3
MRDKESGETLGVCFTQHLEVTPHPMHYPSKWNIQLQKHHIMSIKRTVAKALLPVLVDELGHLTSENHGPDGVVVRARETEVRATCDTCLTSLFSRSWMCRRCGREQCADCYTTLKEHTFIDRNATREQRLEHDAKRERHAQTNPSFFTCCRKDDHDWSYFFPVSRFTNQELVDAINSMRRLVDGESAQSGVEVLSLAHSPEFSGSPNSSASSSAGPPTPPDTLSCLPSVLPNSLVIGGPPHPRNSLDKGDIPSWELAIFPHQSLTEEVFRPMWARGEPFAVTGLLQKLKLPWTPEHFIEAYGDQSCLIIECQEDTNKRTTVREFFSEFGKYHGRKECWKLKDWPPMSDFKSSFPTLYDDFSQAVPMPDYVRRDGVLNVASYFPLNTIAPDLGPKMYNAMASNTTVGSKGSTRLHMDMADAVNIMTYAAHKPDGSEGCAAWDLFRAQDSDKIRTFLRSKVRSPNGGPPQDPIHSQQIYLDDHLRLELFRIHGVKSFRFYQRPGEAVFIPAGCAHQVSNLADSVKIAIDFVSPENIARCEQLTREFREQNHSQAWKEDVLQLRSMMWFAWQACCKHEGQESAVTSESNVES